MIAAQIKRLQMTAREAVTIDYGRYKVHRVTLRYVVKRRIGQVETRKRWTFHRRVVSHESRKMSVKNRRCYCILIELDAK